MCSLKDVNIHLFRMGDPAILKGWGQRYVEMRALEAKGGEYCKKKKSFSLRLETKRRCLLLPLLFNKVLEVQVKTIRQEKEITNIQT